MPGPELPTLSKPVSHTDGVEKIDETSLSAAWHTVCPKRRLAPGRHIACNIDNESMQLAACSRGLRRVKLLDIRKIYVPSTASSPEQWADFVCGTIGDYMTEFGRWYSTVSLVVGGSQTALRTFVMPPLAGSELRSAVDFEAKKQVPFPIADCESDFRIVQTFSDAGLKQLRVSVLAAIRQMLEDRLRQFDRVDCRIAHVYHAQDVIGQMLRELDGFEEGSNYALINIERSHTEIAYYHGSYLEFFHISALGSSFLSNRADSTMFEYFSESLATEIQNSLDYYSGQFPTHFANQILIHGDMSYSEDLIDRLTDRFGFSFKRFPAERLGFVHDRDADFEMSLPVCLQVLAAATCGYKLANLLPRPRIQARDIRRVNRLGVLGLIVMCLLIVVAWLLQRADLNRANSILLETNNQVESFRQSTVFDTYNLLKRQIAIDQSYLERIKETPSYLGLNLKELSLLTPRAIQLRNLEYNAADPARNLQIAGTVTHFEIPPEIILAEYVENLTRSPFFEDVTVDRHFKRQAGQLFELEFQISARGVI